MICFSLMHAHSVLCTSLWANPKGMYHKGSYPHVSKTHFAVMTSPESLPTRFFHSMRIEILWCIFFSHPYMEKPRPPIPAAAGTIGQVTENRRRQQGPPPSYPRQPQATPTPITTTTRAPPVQVKRILALPIISSSYASTNYQGGSTRYGHTFTHLFLFLPFVKKMPL